MTVEFGPIVVFSLLVEQTSFLVATAWFVVLTAVSLIAAFIERRSFALFPFVVATSVIAFGTLTLYFKDPFFFIFKDTIYNATFGILIFIFLNRGIPLLKPLFKDTFAMTDIGWKVLSKRWGVMFLLLALSNELVRGFLTPEQWAFYKITATIVTAVFGFYQLTLSKKYRLPQASEWGMRL